MWRQGDIFFQEVDRLPDGVVRKGDFVLAEGELTGHVHEVLGPQSAVLFEGMPGVLYLHVTAKEATVVHQEHGPISLPQGLFRVWRQREYTQKGVRRVMD